MLNSGLLTSDHNSWETPKALFEQLDQMFGFTLDVCATRENSKCHRYFSQDQNALGLVWDGTCWMNPPFGREISQWVAKAYQESRKRTCAVVSLLPVRSDTKWWHQYVMKSSRIMLLTRRLTFETGNAASQNKAPFPAAVVVFQAGQERPTLEPLAV